MTRRIIGTLLLAAATVSCTGSPPAPEAPRSPVQRLEAILATAITPEQDSAYRAFAREHGADVQLYLPAIALDRSTDPLARANAVLRMGAIPMLAFDVYASTIQDPDPRVRGATLGVVGPFATRAPDEALPILARGLVDPEVGIQAKALQELRDRDLDMLRFYIESDPPPELRHIALQTIRNSQAWGAPLEPEADGSLRRVTPAGVELILRPEVTYPELDLVIGTLSVVPAGGSERVLADSIEAVLTIIPAVVDATGRYVAVERARRIDVHDLETGATRSFGAGIAPRPLPFTPDFLYFRTLRQIPSGAGTTLMYELVRAPFEAGSAMPFDTVNVVASNDLRGNLSPLRWARIYDRGTRFVVDTDGLRNHVLPSPLDEAARIE